MDMGLYSIKSEASQRAGRQFGRAVSNRLFILGLLVTATPLMPKPAYAGGECAAAIAQDAAMTAASNTFDVLLSAANISLAFTKLNTSLKLYAGDVGNTAQAANNTDVALVDTKTANETGVMAASERFETLREMTPSAVSCSFASASMRAAKTTAARASQMGQIQQAALKIGMNGSGTRSEKGALANVAGLFSERCSKYADPTKMKLPSGMSCDGPSDTALRDLDIRPWEAIIDPIVLSDPKRMQAAQDAIEMLTDVEGADPVRGPALNGQVGQAQHVQKARDVTRMNLAKAVLSDAVAMRTPSADAGGISRLAAYMELATGKKFDPSTNSLQGAASSVADAASGTAGSPKSLASRVAAQQALLFEVMRLSEMIMAVDSVELAIKLEQNKGRGAIAASFSAK